MFTVEDLAYETEVIRLDEKTRFWWNRNFQSVVTALFRLAAFVVTLGAAYLLFNLFNSYLLLSFWSTPCNALIAASVVLSVPFGVIVLKLKDNLLRLWNAQAAAYRIPASQRIERALLDLSVLNEVSTFCALPRLLEDGFMSGVKDKHADDLTYKLRLVKLDRNSWKVKVTGE